MRPQIRSILPLMIIIMLAGSIFMAQYDKNDVSASPTRSSDAIDIDGNSEFVSFVNDQGLAGSGSWQDPYLISGYDIDCTDQGNGIAIKNVSLPFIIKDCRVTNSKGGMIHKDSYQPAIVISDSKCGFENVSLFNNDIGISLDSVSNLVIRDCYLSNNDIGVLIIDSEEVTIDNSTIEDSSVWGSYVMNSNNIGIYNSYLDGEQGNGIVFLRSNDVILAGNVIMNFDDGIVIGNGTEGCAIKLNVIRNCNGFAINISSSSLNIFIRENSILYNNRSGSYPRINYNPQIFNNALDTIVDSNHWKPVDNDLDNDEDGLLDYPYWFGPGIDDVDRKSLKYPQEQILPPPSDLKLIHDHSTGIPIIFTWKEHKGFRNSPIHYLYQTYLNQDVPEGSGGYSMDMGRYTEIKFEEPPEGSVFNLRMRAESHAGESKWVYVKFPEFEETPHLEFLSHENGTLTKNGSIDITYSAWPENGGELAHYYLARDGRFLPVRTPGYLDCGMKEGWNQITIKVVDDYNNEIVKTLWIELDSTPPFFDFGGYTKTNYPAEVWWEFPNGIEPGTRMWWADTSFEWIEIDPMSGSIVFEYPEGDHRIILKSEDILGNEFKKSITLAIRNDLNYPTEWGPIPQDYEPGNGIYLRFKEYISSKNLNISIPGWNFTVGWGHSGVIIHPERNLTDDDILNIYVKGMDMYGNPLFPIHIRYDMTKRKKIVPSYMTFHIFNTKGIPVRDASLRGWSPYVKGYDDDGDGVIFTSPSWSGFYIIKVDAPGFETTYIEYDLAPGENATITVVMEEEYSNLESDHDIGTDLKTFGGIFGFIIAIILFIYLITRRHS